MNREAIEKHLGILWGNLEEDEGLIEIGGGVYDREIGGFPKGGAGSWRCRRAATVAEAVALAVEDCEAGREVYVCGSSGLTRRGLKRFKKTDAHRTCGLWADLDVEEHGGHAASKKYPPTKAVAEELVRRIGLPPTLLLDTGGGLQAWWLFQEYADTSSAELVATHESRQKELIALLNVHAEQMGAWRFDAVTDVVRVLRVAGTLNHKRGAPHEILLVEENGPRYGGIEDFEEACSSIATLVAAKGGESDPLRAEIESAIEGRTIHEYDSARLEVMKDNDPRLARSWIHDRPDLGNDSSAIDASIAFALARTSCPPMEIARMLSGCRHLHGDSKGKGVRADYLARTVSWAVQAVERKLTEAEAIHAQRTVDLDALEENPGELLSQAREGAGLPDLVGVVQRGTTDASFYFEFEDAEEIHIGGIDILRSQPKLGNRLLEARGGRSVLRKKTRDDWEKVSLMLVRVARVIEIPENERVRELLMLVADYAASYKLHADEDCGEFAGEWKMSVLTDTPFLYVRRFCFRPDAFFMAARARGYETSKREFRKVLLEAGGRVVDVQFREDGRKVKRRCVAFDPELEPELLQSVRERAVQPERWSLSEARAEETA